MVERFPLRARLALPSHLGDVGGVRFAPLLGACLALTWAHVTLPSRPATQRL